MFDRRRPRRGFDCSGERVTVAHLWRDGFAGERVDFGDQPVGRFVGLSGRFREVPAVDESIEHHEPGEGFARHLTEGCCNGSLECPG